MRRWSDELLHLFLSFGAGILLGLVFLHLIPEALSYEGEGSTELFILVGFLLIFFLERILFIGSEGDYDRSHMVVSITVLLGLSVHALIEGAGLAIGALNLRLGTALLVSILAHKVTAAFSLTSLLLLGKFSRGRTFFLLIVFSLATPIGALAFTPVLSTVSASFMASLTGLTAGTFLYIATGDLLPEVFHTRQRRWTKLFLLIVGVVCMSLLRMVE